MIWPILLYAGLRPGHGSKQRDAVKAHLGEAGTPSMLSLAMHPYLEASTQKCIAAVLADANPSGQGRRVATG